MKNLAILLLLLCASITASAQKTDTTQVPEMFKGSFVDDYGIKYIITDTLWQQLPGTKFHIIKWNVKEQYLVPVTI
jgi:hypothetical protein